MSRFFITDMQIGDGLIRIVDPEDTKHLTRVLRVKPGEAVDVSDGVFEYETVMAGVEDDMVLLRITAKRPLTTEMPVELDLFQGVPKHGKMDVIVQKSVELGVASIIPVFMERTIPNETAKYGKRIERFTKIAEAAAKQCGRGRIPDIKEPLTDEGLFKELKNYELVLFLYENEEGTTLKDALSDYGRRPKRAALVVGPEGGFSEEEADLLGQMPNCRTVTVGPRILRTETAGPAALAMCMYEWEL